MDPGLTISAAAVNAMRRDALNQLTALRARREENPIRRPKEEPMFRPAEPAKEEPAKEAPVKEEPVPMVLPPVVVERTEDAEPPKQFSTAFRVTGTLDQLKALKKFLIDGEYAYEQLT